LLRYKKARCNVIDTFVFIGYTYIERIYYKEIFFRNLFKNFRKLGEKKGYEMKKIIVLMCICGLIIGISQVSFAYDDDDEQKVFLKRHNERWWGLVRRSISEESKAGKSIQLPDDEKVAILGGQEEPFDLNFVSLKAKAWLAEGIGVKQDEIIYVGYEHLGMCGTVGDLTIQAMGDYRYAFNFSLKNNPGEIISVSAGYNPGTRTWENLTLLPNPDPQTKAENPYKEVDLPLFSHLPGIGRPVPGHNPPEITGTHPAILKDIISLPAPTREVLKRKEIERDAQIMFSCQMVKREMAGDKAKNRMIEK